MTSLIGAFLTGDYKVLRSGPGRVVKGRYHYGPPEELRVAGSMQPSTARELKLPEEGNRLKQFWRFFTDEPIVLNSMSSLADSDRVVIDGEEYRAMARTRWQNTDLDYFETILWREPSQDSDGTGEQ